MRIYKATPEKNKRFFNNLNLEINLNKINKFSFWIIDNTLHHHYKGQLVCKYGLDSHTSWLRTENNTVSDMSYS